MSNYVFVKLNRPISRSDAYKPLSSVWSGFFPRSHLLRKKISKLFSAKHICPKTVGDNLYYNYYRQSIVFFTWLLIEFESGCLLNIRIKLSQYKLFIFLIFEPEILFNRKRCWNVSIELSRSSAMLLVNLSNLCFLPTFCVEHSDNFSDKHVVC